MRSSGDGTAVGGPYPLHDGAPAEPVRGARVAAQPAPPCVDGADDPERIGYRGPTACAAAGITYRQLDYWARTGLVEPSVRPAYGSGSSGSTASGMSSS